MNGLSVKNERVLIGLLLGLFLAIGLWVHKDYGLAWDEPKQRWIGQMAWQMASGGGSELLEVQEKNYGPALEMILAGMEGLLKESSGETVYRMRHLAVYLLFLVSVFVFYRLCRGRFGGGLALTGALFLLLSPRMFAHAFFNSKDAGFMALFILAAAAMRRFEENPAKGRALVLAAVSAFLIDTRIVGILIPALTLLSGALRLAGDSDQRRRRFSSLLIYTGALGLLTVAFWPYLWADPWNRFFEAYRAMAHYNWGGTVLYLGEWIKADRIPWHYIPVWIAVTTPLLYSVFFLLGCATVPWGNLKKDGWVLIWFFAPLAAVITSQAVLYDGWRQLYFIYPAFLWLALAGLEWLRRRGRKVFWAGLVVIGAQLLYTGYRMIELHPYEHLYFNRLAGKNLGEIKSRFELDYWGLSYAEGIHYILAHDPRASVKIHPANYAGDINARALPDADQARLVFLREPEGMDYFMTNYRWHPEDYDEPNEVFTVTRDGAKLLSVFRTGEKN